MMAMIKILIQCLQMPNKKNRLVVMPSYYLKSQLCVSPVIKGRRRFADGGYHRLLWLEDTTFVKLHLRLFVALYRHSYLWLEAKRFDKAQTFSSD